MRLPGNSQKSCKFFCRGLDIRVTEAVDIDIAQIISLAKLPQPIDRRCVAHMNCLIPYMQPMDTLNYGITTIVS